MFFELYERFSAVADIEEQQQLSHSTVDDLIQYGAEQIYPPDEGTSPFDSGKIAWQRHDADPVPDEDRQSIMEKTLSILRRAE